MVTLKLKNEKYRLLITEEETKRYRNLLTDIMKIIKYLSENENYQQLVHVYLCTITLIMNEPEFAEEHKVTIKSIIDKLLSEEVIYEDNMLVEYGTGIYFVSEFFNQDYETQNQVLYLDKRNT